MKKLTILIVTFLAILLSTSCASHQKRMSSKKGLMLLEPHEHAKNQRMTSTSEYRKKKRTYKKFSKRNRQAYRNNNMRFSDR